MEIELSQNQRKNDNFSSHKAKEQNNINKNSVSTSVGQGFNVESIEPYKCKKEITSEITENKRTKFIKKNVVKGVMPMLKNRNVLKTLRDITNNIKNHIKQKKSDNQQQENIKPPAPIVKSPQVKFNQKEVEVQKIQQSFQIAQQKENHCQNPNIQTNKIQPCQVRNVQLVDKITLISRNGNQVQTYPVFQDKAFTNKKEFRNMTIERGVDNDVDSDNQQIQLSVGYMYYELLQSCQKQTQRVKYEQSQKKQNYARLSHVKQSYLKSSQKNIRHEVPLDRVKQKLVFM